MSAAERLERLQSEKLDGRYGSILLSARQAQALIAWVRTQEAVTEYKQNPNPMVEDKFIHLLQMRTLAL